jgi:hypothetical protein
MNRLALASACALALGLAATPAAAVTCYVVMDRNDNVIYRDIVPPVDLSDAGTAAREAMRRRGEFLLFHESEACPAVEFFTGGAGTVSLSLDQTLAPSPPPKPDPAAAAPPARARR